MSVNANTPVDPVPQRPAAGDPPATIDPAARQRGRRTLLLLALVCLAPVVLSYLAFYLMPPDGRTNYGDLIDPQRDLRALAITSIVAAEPETTAPAGSASTSTEAAAVTIRPAVVPGTPITLNHWTGRWLMVTANPGLCDTACAQRLYAMRQVRLTQGRERGRIERLWLITDSQPPDERILAGYEGMHIARIDPQALRTAFPAADGQDVLDHIYLIDPLGNLMMRFPANADPSRMKKDFTRLLKASRIG